MLDQLHSFAGTHAIESATISIGWGIGPIDMKLLDAFRGLEGEFRAWGFTNSVPVNLIRFEYSNQVASTASNQVGGHAFQKVNPTSSNVVLREVSLRDNQFVIMVADYARWDALWTDIAPIVARLLGLLTQQDKQVAAVSLQYMDRFTWRSTTTEFPTTQVLQSSAFFPLTLFADSPQWHSNQGFFVDSAVRNAGRRLDNVVVTLGLEGQFPALSLALVHQYSDLTKPSGIKDIDSLMPLMQEAHNVNKDYISKLLTPAVCTKINLTSQ